MSVESSRGKNKSQHVYSYIIKTKTNLDWNAHLTFYLLLLITSLHLTNFQLNKSINVTYVSYYYAKNCTNGLHLRHILLIMSSLKCTCKYIF